jgi:hypothetical protein
MKRTMLLAMFAVCAFTLWMCSETEFDNSNNSVHSLDARDPSSFTNISLDSADTVCATLVTAIPGIGGCPVLLQTNDSTKLNPLQPHQSLVVGHQYLIGYEYRDQPSLCAMGKLIQLTCIQPADSTNVIVR